jgi:hypothetical protein
MADLPIVLDLLRTLATIAVPVVVAVLGYRLNQRLKLWEASQWRNQELIKARLRYFDQLAPMLSDLMSYLTFVGRWKELTPPEVIQIKRDADRLFLSVAPLFSQRGVDAYQGFIRACFDQYVSWGVDARIRSGVVRRRDAYPGSWDPEWQNRFTHSETDEISQEDLIQVRNTYDLLLAALAEDIELSAPRDRYVITQLSADAR